MKIQTLYRLHAPIYDLTRRPFLVDRARAVHMLLTKPGDRVIDFACGTGANVPHLKRAGAGDIVGLDLTPAMLRRAECRFPGVRFVRGDITSFRIPGPPADRVICSYGLSMVPNWRGAIRNMHAHLRPGGTLVVLDFGRMTGGLRFLDPALEFWFRGFGVRRGLPVDATLGQLFEDYRTEVRHGGWNGIVVARGAREV